MSSPIWTYTTIWFPPLRREEYVAVSGATPIRTMNASVQTPFQSTILFITRLFQSAAAAVALTNSNIICAADDDDANSVMTAATSNSNPDIITATTAADNLGFDHPDVVEQLMKFDFEFADSRSQSICLAQHQGQSHAEAEQQTQYLGQSEAQTQQQQHYNQCHSPIFEFQVRCHQIRINCIIARK